jgi:hypothetical protein
MPKFRVFARDDETIFMEDIEAADQQAADEVAIDLIAERWELDISDYDSRDDFQAEYLIAADPAPDLDKLDAVRAILRNDAGAYDSLSDQVDAALSVIDK